MAAYIDEHRSRFRVGPICRVLSESLDCGFLTPRGCRMFRTRPVSRMRARREALARAVLQIRSDFFMAVYGYGKMHAQLVAQGWDPAGVGRDRVMNIMRGLGIRGVRRGRTPVTTKPAKGTGGRPDLVDGRFEACAPNRLHVAGITYVRMANGSFGCTAFADGVYARRIVGWACAMTMNTQELPLQALGQAISWAASRGGADGLIRHGDHGTQCTGTVYTTGVMEYGMLPSTGTVGDSYDNAMAESADGAYKTELVWRRKPFADLKDLELATFRWVSWRGLEAPAPVPGLQDTRSGGNRVLSTSSGTSRLAIRTEQKSGHFTLHALRVMGTSAHPSAWSCWTKRTSWSLTHRLASSVSTLLNSWSMIRSSSSSAIRTLLPIRKCSHSSKRTESGLAATRGTWSFGCRAIMRLTARMTSDSGRTNRGRTGEASALPRGSRIWTSENVTTNLSL